MFCHLLASSQWVSKWQKTDKFPNIKRWYKLVESQQLVKRVLQSLPDDVKATPRSSPSQGTATGGRKEEGKFVDLPGAEEGKVVVRFPPEASG